MYRARARESQPQVDASHLGAYVAGHSRAVLAVPTLKGVTRTRLLIVEDDPEVRQAMAEVLSEAGYLPIWLT